MTRQIPLMCYQANDTLKFIKLTLTVAVPNKLITMPTQLVLCKSTLNKKCCFLNGMEKIHQFIMHKLGVLFKHSLHFSLHKIMFRLGHKKAEISHIIYQFPYSEVLRNIPISPYGKHFGPYTKWHFYKPRNGWQEVKLFIPRKSPTPSSSFVFKLLVQQQQQERCLHSIRSCSFAQLANWIIYYDLTIYKYSMGKQYIHVSSISFRLIHAAENHFGSKQKEIRQYIYDFWYPIL